MGIGNKRVNPDVTESERDGTVASRVFDIATS
jgi:hypothetical protein